MVNGKNAKHSCPEKRSFEGLRRHFRFVAVTQQGQSFHQENSSPPKKTGKNAKGRVFIKKTLAPPKKNPGKNAKKVGKNALRSCLIFYFAFFTLTFSEKAPHVLTTLLFA